MAINATSTEQKRELTPAGVFAARCFQIIEIGTVTQEFKGQKKALPKVWIGFELPTELRVFKEEKGEQPLCIYREFTLSLFDKAKLRDFLEGWRGIKFTEEQSKKFDISVLIGKECMASIVHTEDGKYANLSTVTAVPKGMTVPPAINPPFLLSYDAFDFDKFESLPDFIKDKMKVTPEFLKMTGQFQESNLKSKGDYSSSAEEIESYFPF